MHKATVVMPAYNAAKTLEKTINDLPLDYVHELILVDDASMDDTTELAKSIAISHPRLAPVDSWNEGSDTIPFIIDRLEKNKGYGGNQKRCYDIALSRNADIVVMVHPDWQYDPKLVKPLVEFIRDGYVDVMLGARIRSMREARAGGMPRYKFLANRFLTEIENLASGRNLAEWHSGLRAYSASALRSVNYHAFSDDFIFDQQILFALIEQKQCIGDIPAPVRYFDEASSINFRRSARYGLLTLAEAVKHIVRKLK